MTDSTLIAISAGTVWLLGLTAFLTWYRLRERNWRWLDWPVAWALVLWPVSLVILAVQAIDDLWKARR